MLLEVPPFSIQADLWYIMRFLPSVGMTSRAAGSDREAVAAAPPLLLYYLVTAIVIPNATQWSEESLTCFSYYSNFLAGKQIIE